RSRQVPDPSRAPAIACLVSMVGLPNEQSRYLPMTLCPAESERSPDFSARSTISGPIPAQSPSVIPRRSFLLALMLVIVIESYTNRARVIVDLAIDNSESPDVRFRAYTG